MMTFVQRPQYHEQWPAVVTLLAALVLTAILYLPGRGGTIHFDDPHNLNGLTAISDGASAIDFALNGHAGPTGRPLALASFVPQAYAWPHSPDVFLQTNICIHLLNGALVAWLLYLLGIAAGRESRPAALVASFSATVWMLLPILASSTLLIVQRMTTLAGTFVLLGIIGYLYARRLSSRRPRLALLLMSLSVGIGTLLATFTKENGILLPTFVLLLEGTLLRELPLDRNGRRIWQAWRVVFLVVPTLALLAYLAMRLRYGESIVLIREFTGADRLLTQARVLWEYLYHAFMPTQTALGPFHDDHPVYRDWLDPLSILGVAGWVGAAAAVVLVRKKLPLVAFGAGWYLVGHAVESTTLPLELYFEHRNYLPLVGPVFAAITAGLALTPRLRMFALAGLTGYVSVLAVALFNTTALWGQPDVAAEMWAIYHPSSKRAVHYLAARLQLAGDPLGARRVLLTYRAKHEPSALIDLQLLGISCSLQRTDLDTGGLSDLEALLRTAKFEHGIADALRDLYRMALDEQCEIVTRDSVYALASAATDNRAFRSNAVTQHNLHTLMAEEALKRRDLDLTMKHLESALSAVYAYPTLAFAVYVLRSAGLDSVAQEFVQQAEAHRPRNPLQAAIWSRQLAALSDVAQGAL